MNLSKRILTLLFSVMMAATTLTACGETKDTVNEDTSASVETESETSDIDLLPETESETSDIDLLPEADMNGYTFHILSTDPATLWGYLVSIMAEEETGEPVNDAVYRRNNAIEERYSIEIVNSCPGYTDVISQTTQNLAVSGEDTYAIISYAVRDQLSDVLKGCFRNLHSIESIDFNNLWWNKECADMLTIQDKLYVGLSEWNLISKDTLTNICVNNDIVEAHNMESPYTLVKEGRWTMDAMYDMQVTATQDLDGNGEISEGDVIGFAGGSGAFNAMLNGGNQPYILMNSDGKWTLNEGTEGSIAAAEKIARIVNDKQSAAFQDEQAWGFPSFNEGKALFCQGTSATLRGLREAEIGVSVLPTPKFDENQANYRTMLSNQSMTIAVPVTNNDVEKTGLICEALGAYSRIPMREVYYETVLKTKLARDQETAEMLDIIFDNICVDVGVLNETAWGSVITNYFNSIRKYGAEQLASVAASAQKEFETRLSTIEEKYTELQ